MTGRSAMGEVQWLSVWKWAANLWNCGLEFADKCERHRAVSVGIPRIAYMSLCFVRFYFILGSRIGPLLGMQVANVSAAWILLTNVSVIDLFLFECCVNIHLHMS